MINAVLSIFRSLSVRASEQLLASSSLPNSNHYVIIRTSVRIPSKFFNFMVFYRALEVYAFLPPLNYYYALGFFNSVNLNLGYSPLFNTSHVVLGDMPNRF